MDTKPNFFREVKLQWAGSRDRNLGSGRGRTFFLTSLFIELIEGFGCNGLISTTRVFEAELGAGSAGHFG
jgi:hypothetical protein